MAKQDSVSKVHLSSFDDLFQTDESREDLKRERLMEIPISLIHDFPDHPYKVKDDENMFELVESIKTRGLIQPVLVRPLDDGTYEMVSGHRRKRAFELANIEKIPARVQELTMDEAILSMVDSNLQRDEILPSEKAFAFKMRLEAMNRQGKRTDLTCAPSEHKLLGEKTRDIIARENNESREQVRRYIRLNELTPELLEFVDEGKIGLRPAVELSYLQEDEMRDLVDFIDDEDIFPSHAQTIRMRALSKDGKLDTETIREIMFEEKPNQKPRIKIPMERIEKYFPSGTSQQQMEDIIVKALAMYHQRQRANRDAR